MNDALKQAEPAVKAIATQFGFGPHHADRDDVCQLARLALTDAHKRWTPTRGPWINYARQAIRQSCALSRRTGRQRLPMHSDGDTVATIVDRTDDRERDRLIADLRQDVLADPERHGLSRTQVKAVTTIWDNPGKSIADIATLLGYTSPAPLHQLLSRVRKRLAESVEAA